MTAGQIRWIARLSGLALALVIGLTPAPVLMAGPAQAAGPAAQDVPLPPGLAEEVFRSGLTGPDVFDARPCPSGAAGGEYVDEGFKLTVRGRCVQDASAANLPVPGRDILMLDNDVALDFKVVVGAERAGVNLYARVQGPGNLMAAYLSPASGQIELFKRVNGVSTTVASRGDLGDLIDPSDWNRLALRLHDGDVWLLLNDVPILYTSEGLDQIGGIGVAVVREGDVNDADEVAVVFRDLSLSTLGDGPADAAPDASASGHSDRRGPTFTP